MRCGLLTGSEEAQATAEHDKLGDVTYEGSRDSIVSVAQY